MALPTPTSHDLLESYETTPYPDLCYTQTHPDRLATLGRLLGLNPPPVTECRVLELGCASGGNLIPMAYGLPNSQFVGVDFSTVQVSEGQKTIKTLGLNNVRLIAEDILQITADFGAFDYIIAHGVYSWVPPNVRDKLLSLCGELLTPNGIAYISYNTQPGWHMLGALREMMLFHTRKEQAPAGKAQKAREFVHFLAENIAPTDPYGTMLDAYQQMIQSYDQFVIRQRAGEHKGDDLLLHDELETFNDPVYFYQFIAHAEEYGLQYLVEADFARVLPSNLPPEQAKALMQMSNNIIEMEQYMDFVRNRTFRQTLLCRKEQSFQRTFRPTRALLDTLYIATYAQVVEEETAVSSDDKLSLRGPDSAMLHTTHPLSKAALRYLTAVSPRPVAYPDLLATAEAMFFGDLRPDHETRQLEEARLIETLFQGFSYSIRLIELHVFAPSFAGDLSQRPLASALARLQASMGMEKVTSLRHERVRIDDLSRRLLTLLDGTRNRDDLLQALQEMQTAGFVVLTQANGEDEAQTKAILAAELDQILQFFVRAALLHA